MSGRHEQRPPETVLGAVELRHVPGFIAVMLTTRATYVDLAAPYARLVAWTAAIEVLPCGAPICLFYGDPAASPHVEGRVSLCLPVSAADADRARAALSGHVPPPMFAPTVPPANALEPPSLPDPHAEAALLRDGDVVEVRQFPRGLAAVVFFRGPLDTAATAYTRLREWVKERPYLPSGAMREVFLAEPGSLGPGLTEVEVHQPVVAGGR